MKNKTKGLLFILLPIVSLVFILIAYAVSSFTTYQMSEAITLSQNVPISATTTSLDTSKELAETDIRITVVRLINVILSFLGILAVLGIMIGIPFGIYFLNKKDEQLGEEQMNSLKQHEKYKNLTDEQITFIHKWSGGAFLAPTIWALTNKMYLWALGTFVPLFNLYVWIKLSIDGRKMTWEQKNWNNFEQLKKRQKITAWIIVIVIILYIILSILDV